MPPAESNFSNFAVRVMSGVERGPRASILRGALAVGQIPYWTATQLRNWTFNAGIRKPARLPRPVIGVGNITTGGTGKTPVVRWLAERLRDDGLNVAILSRGYKALRGELGDEQRMLQTLLQSPLKLPVMIRANPSRLQAGRETLLENPNVDVFLLDDGFQHRQLARNFDLVLIDAAEPFGFGHLLPRGMLREPLSNLGRASAFLITRSNGATDSIRQTLARFNSSAPIYESVHAPMRFRRGTEEIPLDAIREMKWFAFSGIGNPNAFVTQLKSLGGGSAGDRSFADHHAYTSQDLAAIQDAARQSGAEILVTTEKDWVKIAPLAGDLAMPIWRLDVEIRFSDPDQEQRLLADIRQAIESARGR
jgi:tetraacyldisaccharide 4'-kinase